MDRNFKILLEFFFQSLLQCAFMKCLEFQKKIDCFTKTRQKAEGISSTRLKKKLMLLLLHKIFTFVFPSVVVKKALHQKILKFIDSLFFIFVQFSIM